MGPRVDRFVRDAILGILESAALVAVVEGELGIAVFYDRRLSFEPELKQVREVPAVGLGALAADGTVFRVEARVAPARVRERSVPVCAREAVHTSPGNGVWGRARDPP